MQTWFLFTIALHCFCAVHVVRNGHAIPWLFFVVACPVLGCLLYYACMMGADLRGDVVGVARRALRLVDPHRDLRAKRRTLMPVASADAKRTLAEECMKHDCFDEAVALLETAAMGLHADDPALLHGLARARFLNNDPSGAERALAHLREANPDWTSASAHLLFARALEEQGKWQEALIEYDALIGYHSGEEARCRMAVLLQKQGHVAEARALFETVLRAMDRVPKERRGTRGAWVRLARRHLELMRLRS